MDITYRWGIGPHSSLRAGLAYAVIVFAIGAALGTIRVLFLAPRVGAALAVSLEAPLMLVASWWVSQQCVSYFRVCVQSPAPFLMGASAFVTLMLLEITLSAAVFDQSPTDYLLSFKSVPGAIGLAAQLAFAGIPLVQASTAEGRSR